MALDLLTTAEVYQQASVIGQDIEKIIDRYGHEAVLDLMPRVVQVLEDLELLVCEREKEKLEIAELKMENERLYFEIKREACQRRKLDEELFNAQNDGEVKNLKTIIVKLQEENKRLRMEYEMSANEKPGDVEVMQRMKETIDTQRDVIRSRNLEIESQKADVDAMEEQIERLANINESLRKNLAVQQSRMSALAKEKAECEAKLKILKLELKEQDEGKDLDVGKCSDGDDGRCLEDAFANMDVQIPQIAEKREKENGHHNGQELSERKGDFEIVQVAEKEKAMDGNEKVESSTRTLERDPNRPRYTKAELLEILIERNKLKEEVFSLKEELSWYKPTDETETQINPEKSPNTRISKREESGISKIFSIFTSRKTSTLQAQSTAK